MYLPPREAVQALWSKIAELLRADSACAELDIPEGLSWVTDVHGQWMDADLLLSQACGYPLTTLLKGKVKLVGTFAYRAPGVEGISCRSQLICRADESRTKFEEFAHCTLAYNDTISQSGYNALRALVARQTRNRPFFAHTIETGAHYLSIEAVRAGKADIASIDPVSWAHWQTSNPQKRAELRVLGQTDSYPGLPLITSLQTNLQQVQAIQKSLHVVAHAEIFAALRAPLLISGFVATRLEDYQVCIAMQEQAKAAGVLRL